MELAALLKVIEIWDTCVPMVVKGVSVLPVCRFPDSQILDKRSPFPPLKVLLS